MHTELVAFEAHHIEVAAVVLQKRAYLLVEDFVDLVEPRAIRIAHFRRIEIRFSVLHHLFGLRIGCRRFAYRRRQCALEFIPIGLTVLRYGDPVIDIKHIGHMLDVEQRRGEFVVLRFFSTVVRTRNAPGQRLLEDELHCVRIRRRLDFGNFRHNVTN